MKIKQTLILSILIGILGSTCVTARAMDTKMEQQVHIAQEVVRFHIRANSDSKEDQAIKMHVKVRVLEAMKPVMDQAASVTDSRELIANNINQIEAFANQALKEVGSSDSAKVYMTEEWFPVKHYGDLVFPPGKYEALRIDIGEAKGHNWWCVMYPSLCFVDPSHGIVPEASKEKLKKVLTKKEYRSLHPKIRWKLAEILQDMYTK